MSMEDVLSIILVLDIIEKEDDYETVDYILSRDDVSSNVLTTTNNSNQSAICIDLGTTTSEEY